MGEVIPLFPNRRERFQGIRHVYGIIVLSPFKHLINVREFMQDLHGRTLDGEHLSDDIFYDYCSERNLEPDTSFEIYEALSLNGIFIFT